MPKPKIFASLVVCFLLVFLIGGRNILSGLVKPLPTSAVADPAAEEAKLQAQLQTVEQEISQNKDQLQVKQKETASIKRDVDILTGKVNIAKLNIQAKEITIQGLGSDINHKVSVIGQLNEKVVKEKQSLSELLRQTKEIEDQSLLEVTLSSESLSTLFDDASRFSAVQRSVQDSLGIVRTTKTMTEQEKTALEIKKDQEMDARKTIETEKARVERLNSEKKVYLGVSKAQESAYRTIIAQKEKERAAIRSVLFKLRNAQSITFGEALDIAKTISAKTGVRPAFLLAIITQESNLGQNVGTCNRSGDPASKSWRNVMKPGRDDGPFLRITKGLGLDPDTQPVSCPYGGGYGGAMGPAQFIPSTWENYEDRISAVTGNNPPNPWVAQDAFTASALYLKDLGAGVGTYSAERKAALKYYAGSNWSNPKNAFYGSQVMAIVAKYDEQIEILQND